MKVIHVCPRYHPYIGGVETHVRSVCRGLSEAGIAVEIYSADAPGRAVKQEVVDGIRLTRFPSFSPRDTICFSPKLHRALKEVQADIIHVHDYRALPMLSAAWGKREDIKLVITLHLGFSKIGKWVYHIYNPLFGKMIFNRADRIVYCAPAELNEVPVLENYKHKMVLIPNGIELTEIDNHYQTKRHLKTTLGLLCASRIEKQKGLRTVIAAVNHLKGMPVNLNVAGDGPDLPRLRDMSSKLGLTDMITFRGWVAKEELYKLYSQSDIFLLLSEFEAYSIALIEAMAFGLVPLVTRVGGNSDMVNDTVGYLVDYPADSEEVATILQQLASNTKLLRQKKRNSRNHALKHFDIETQIKRVIEIYQSIVV